MNIDLITNRSFVGKITEKLMEELNLYSEIVLLEFSNQARFVIRLTSTDSAREENSLSVPIQFFDKYDLSNTQLLSIKENLGTHTLSEVNFLTVEIIGETTGMSFQDIRTFIKSIKYFVNNQIVIFYEQQSKKNVELVIQTKIIAIGELIKLTHDCHISFHGEYVPTLSSIGGQPDLVNWYEQEYLFALKASEYLKQWKIPIPKGLLLSGPPGVGKTLFARTLSAISGTSFFEINAAELVGPLVGEAERALLDLFKEARKNSPTIIFIDEVEALCTTRDTLKAGYENRIVSTFLTEMDGTQTYGDVLVIGATNKPNLIDEAFLRPGRFTFKLNLQLPDEKGRLDILTIHTQAMMLDEACSEYLKKIAQLSKNFSGADLQALTHQAGLLALQDFFANKQENKDKKPVVKQKHFDLAIEKFNHIIKRKI